MNKIPYQIPKEPMKYKSALFNQDVELLTKLRIIRLAKSGISQQKIAKAFGCHRNTVSNLVNRFESLLSPAVQKKLLINKNNNVNNDNDNNNNTNNNNGDNNNQSLSSLSLDKINRLMSPLKRKSSKPHHHPKQPDIFFAYLIYWLHHQKDWRVGYRMMYNLIQRRFKDIDDPWLRQLTNLALRQIRTIYQTFNLKVKKIRTHNGESRPLYDYSALTAFERLHFDVKVLADQHSLPSSIYLSLISKSVPKYQWTIIDAKTRVRFVAYSYNINSEFGFKFLLFVISFIRFSFLNIEAKIVVGMDNGTEFCAGSEKKLKEWNSVLELLNASAYQYHPRFDVRKNLVERSHLMDDRYFLIPRGHLLVDEASFIKEVVNFFYWYNFEKPHTGIGMNNRTPYEALRDTKTLFSERLVTFPLLILDKDINLIRQTVDSFIFQAELKQKQQQYQKTLNQKQIINTSIKYQFFNNNAQKVLTQYPKLLKSS